MRTIISIILVLTVLHHVSLGQIHDATVVKTKVIERAINKIIALENINKISDSVCELIIDYHTPTISRRSGITGWRYEVETFFHSDFWLYDTLNKVYASSFFHVNDTSEYNYVNYYAANQIKLSKNNSYAIIVSQPIVLGWTQLDILADLLEDHGGNKAEFINYNYIYKSYIITLPVIVVRPNWKNRNKFATKQYLCSFQINADDNFTDIKVKLLNVNALGSIWR